MTGVGKHAVNDSDPGLTGNAASQSLWCSCSCAVRNWSQVLVPTVCRGGGRRAPLRTALLPGIRTGTTHRWRCVAVR